MQNHGILECLNLEQLGDHLDQFLAILDFEPTREAMESYKIFS